MKLFGTIVLVLLVSCKFLQAANILCLVGTPRHNNPNWLRPLFSALAARNHSLTLLSTEVDGLPKKNIVGLKLINDYDVVQKHYVGKETGYYNEFWSFKQLLVWYEALLGSCRGLIESEAMAKMHEKVYEALNMEYDLIIYDATFSIDCLLSLLPKKQAAPILGVSGGKLTTDLVNMVKAEDTINPARVPHYLTDLPNTMNYWHRIMNHVMYLGEAFIHWSVVTPVLNGVLKKTYENPPVQLMLLNTHPVLDYAQNLPPNVIEVGGLHIHSKVDDLPENIEEFIDRFVDGIVYINLPYIDLMFGSGPNAVINMIKSQPDCGFIWNVKNLAELPAPMSNLMTLEIEDTIQQNILAQPQVKAFLTHGNSFHLQEAIYYGVPVIVLPLVLEEFNNAQRVGERHLGVVIKVSEFTLDSFVQPLKSLLNDESFMNSLHQSQIRFRSGLQTPLELSVWYAEQLLAEPQIYKHLGQPDSYGQSYFVAHSMDVLVLPVFVFVTFILNLVFLVYQIVEGYKFEKSEKQKKLKEKSPKKLKKLLKEKKKRGEHKQTQKNLSGSNTETDTSEEMPKTHKD